MQTQDVCTAVAAWIEEVCPELAVVYAYSPPGKAALPDCVVALDGQADVMESREFPFHQIQQRHHRVWPVALSFMVDNEDSEAAARLLETLTDRIATLLLSDGNLGGRVPFVSPFSTFDFSRPFVRYADGTKGREVTGRITVGELIEP